MRHMASRVEMCYVRTSPFAIFYCIVYPSFELYLFMTGGMFAF